MTSPTRTGNDHDRELLDEADQHRDDGGAPPPPPPPPPPPRKVGPRFILYQSGDEFTHTLNRLAAWVHRLLIPVYGREVSSTAPWCPEWWRHPEAVALLHGLFLAWELLTGAGSDPTGPAVWHRDFLGPTMAALRDPSGPFAGCKPGAHREKQPPPVVDRTSQAPTGPR
jgi:hypothetical protein